MSAAGSAEQGWPVNLDELEPLADEAIDPLDLADDVIAAVIADERSVYVPKAVRLLGINGVAPGLLDGLLRRARGPAAAPRRD